MNRSDRRTILLALCLAGLAGYVDSLGFLTLQGFFVSFMSGNSTRLAVGLATGSQRTILIAGGLIGLFVLGVVAGTVFQGLTGGRRSQLLLFVALLLFMAAAASGVGREPVAIALATLALGAENVVLQRAGEISIGVTYMTGTLVKLGHGLGGALLGGARREWVPYLLLWASLAAGAVIGAAVFPVVGLGGLWAAAGWCLLLAAAVRIAAEADPAFNRAR